MDILKCSVQNYVIEWSYNYVKWVMMYFTDEKIENRNGYVQA